MPSAPVSTTVKPAVLPAPAAALSKAASLLGRVLVILTEWRGRIVVPVQQGLNVLLTKNLVSTTMLVNLTVFEQ